MPKIARITYGISAGIFAFPLPVSDFAARLGSSPPRAVCVAKKDNDVADDRNKAIEPALAELEKQFGKGSVMRLGSKEVVPISVISTGSISFDAALGWAGCRAGG